MDDETSDSGSGRPSLRDRRRVESMREIQAAAIELVGDRGFDAVTVGDIASGVGVSESTVYRYFGTKERIFTWQDYEPDLHAALLRRLNEQPPVDAVRDAYIEAVAPRYDDGQLARIVFVYQTPQVHTAAVEQSFLQHAVLSKAIEGAAGVDDLTAAVIAGACITAADVAVDHWQQAEGRLALDGLLAEAFDALRHAIPSGDA
ncbi:MAG: TetR family transcriptional regulator [Actinomycetota bacterium]